MGSLLKLGRFTSLLKAIITLASLIVAVLTWVLSQEHIGPVLSIVPATVAGFALFIALKRLLNINTF